MADAKLVVIGGGNMGEAMLRGMLGANLVAAADVTIVEPIAKRREQLADQLKTNVVADLTDAAPAQRYILSVKPQQMEAVLPALAAAIPDAGAMVVSVAAGISTAFIAAALGAKARIVRAMPNTPMLVGAGCTGVCRGPGATDEDMAFAGELFAAGGEVLTVDESAIDAVTAVSGSGPAYFFYLIEAMVAAGVAEGLTEDTAAALASQTCLGAAKLLAATGEAPAVLRAKVTSPGGATEAAIQSMDDSGVMAALTASVRAAAARSRELGK